MDSDPPVADTARTRRPRRRSGGITLHEVAKLAGVSPITASRALNTPEQVAPSTLARVREVIERTGYVPNMVAGSLASTRSRLVAGVVPTILGPVFQDMIESLADALAAAGYQFMIGQSGYNAAREDQLLEAIIGRRPDAIVLTGIVHSAAGRRLLQTCGIPVCETWDLTDTPIDTVVGFSHEKIGEAVARHLVASGKKRLAVLTGDDARALRRRAGFVEEARRAGLAWDPVDGVPTGILRAPTTVGGGRTALTDLLARHPGVDAIFCSSDLLAVGVLIEARARGIPVPEGLAVVGFGDLAIARDFDPPISTVRVDAAAIGRLAAHFVVERVEGRTVAERTVDVGFSVLRRGTG